MLLPLTNPFGATGGGEENLKTNWIAPVEISDPDFNPKEGHLHNRAEAFPGRFQQSTSDARPTATGYNFGGIAIIPEWMTLASIEERIFLLPGTVPDGNVVTSVG